MPKDHEAQPRLVSIQEAIGTEIHKMQWGFDRPQEEREIAEVIKVTAFEEIYRDLVKKGQI